MAHQIINHSKSKIMKRLFFVLFVAMIASQVSAQKLITKTAGVKFSANSSLEKIEGSTNTASTAIDKSTGNIEFALLVKSLKFEKALMEEHFNENYMESTKFPKATFKGKITNNADIKWDTDGKYSAKVTGNLTIHGVTKEVKTVADVTIKGGVATTNSKFSVEVGDYGIEIPALVKDKVAKTAKIEVSAIYNKAN